MRFQYKKIRSTAAAALLSSLASLALAPGLLHDATRSGDALARILPTHAAKAKPHAQAPVATNEALDETSLAADHLDPAFNESGTPADDQPAGTADNAHIAAINIDDAHTGFSGGFVAIGSGWRTHGGAASTGFDNSIPATTAAINQTFVPSSRRSGETDAAPNNGSPMNFAEDESGDTAIEGSGPDQTSDETDLADTGDLNNRNSSDRPHLPVATVPEPSSLALLSAGILGLLACRRRVSR